MTVKKSKGGKSDSRSKKRSQTASSSSSLSVDDKKLNQSDVLGGDLGQQISTEDLGALTDAVDDTSIMEPMTDSMAFTDEPKLTTLIIERHDGEMSGGHFDGFGKAYFVNGNIYEGLFSGGTMQGKGLFQWTSEGIIYEGDFCNNEIIGRGKYTWPDGSSYVGDVVQGIRNGDGIYTHPSGKSYSGSWLNGQRNGLGIMNYDTTDVSFYEGEWTYNVIQGEGFRQYRSGNTYRGDWYLGKRHGHGTMKWIDRNEQYTGQWKNGIQNGYGQHIWFVKRIESSQYSLRNIYEGDFVNGKRHGYGVFTYASGARYVGQWADNMKCGQGTFIFKNGRNYEGLFENDRMIEFPNMSISGRDSPDIKLERMHHQSMQDDVDNLSARTSICSLNTTSPSFLLSFDHLLNDPQITCPDEEMIQIQKAVMAQLAPIRKIYQFYSSLGDQTYSIDNTAAMNQMQFWRFLKDCRLHFDGGPTLSKIDRVLAASINVDSPDDIHNPLSRILLLRFISYIVTIGHQIFASSYSYDEVSGSLLATCFNDIIQKNILVYACNVGGIFYSDIKKTDEIIKHFDPMLEVYREFCGPRKEYPYDISMRLRDFLIIMKNLNLINQNLTAAEIVRILSLDDPNVKDDQFVCLENEITFYEFCEALIQCASIFITRDMINEYIDPKPSSAKSTIHSDNLEDSETEHTFTMSRPITSDSNKHDNLDLDDRSNNRSKPQSGKTKISSADSSNAKSRKQEVDKTSVKKPHKSSKGPKVVTNRSRKASMDKDSSNRKQSLLPSEFDEKMSSVPGVTVNDNEFSIDMSNRQKSDVTEEIREFNEEQEFNYWTHQTHLFLTKYFFPAAEKYIWISKKIEERQMMESQDGQIESGNLVLIGINTDNEDQLINQEDNVDVAELQDD